MSRDYETRTEAESLGQIADRLSGIEDILRNYLRFSLGLAARSMRAMGEELPPEIAEIVKELESYEP